MRNELKRLLLQLIQKFWDCLTERKIAVCFSRNNVNYISFHPIKNTTMSRKLFYPLLLLLVITLSSGECKKLFTNLDADGLPPATQTGANTLGFLLNGQPWTPKGLVGQSANLRVAYDHAWGGLLVLPLIEQRFHKGMEPYNIFLLE
jgi:hypothetical protein